MRIGNLNLDERVMVVAEIGNNHEGSYELAEQLIGLAAEAGADAVKFQTFRTEHYVSRADRKRFEQLQSFELTIDQFERLSGTAAAAGVLFVSTPFDLDSARGLVFSGAVLLALARHGLSRDEAYRLVQGHALAVADEGGHLYDRLSADPEVTKLLTGDELAACFDLEEQLRHVDAIFERVLGKEGRV